jgi:uncharacterized protein YjiS (DUF1127 family)
MDRRVITEQGNLIPNFPQDPHAVEVEALLREARRLRDAALAARVKAGFALLGDAFSTLAGALRDWPRRRGTYERLRGLSDRQLADLGMARGDITRVFEPGFVLPHHANGNGAQARAA